MRCLVLVTLAALAAPFAAAQPGALDPTYGTDGVARSVFLRDASDQPEAVAVAPDGSVVLAGISGGQRRAVARLLPDGTLDAAFGGGMVLLSDASLDVYGVAHAPGGGVYVCGQRSLVSGESDAFVARLRPDGTPDPAFGTGGVAVVDLGLNAFEAFWNVAVAPGGGVAAVGFANGTSLRAVARLTAAGAPEAGFGTGGVAPLTGVSLTSQARVAVRPDGRVLVAGGTNGASPQRMIAAQLTTAGALDATFGTGGVATVLAGPGGSQARALALQTDGALVLAGTSKPTSGNLNVGVARLLADGTPDPAWGTAGVVQTQVSSSPDIGSAVAVAPDGTVVVAGSVASSTSSGVLIRYTSAGALDASFGTGGIARPADGALYSSPLFGVGVVGGAVVAGGWAQTEFLSDPNAVALRVDAAGVLDAAYGTGGITQAGLREVAPVVTTAQTATADGGMALVGALNRSSTSGCAVARLGADGALVPTFGDSGTAELFAASTTRFQCTAVAEAPDGGLFVAGFIQRGFQNALGIARLTPAGVLDAGFGTGGFFESAWRGAASYPAVVALPDGGAAASALLDFANTSVSLVRVRPDGTADPAFGTAGTVTVDVAAALGTASVSQPQLAVGAGGAMHVLGTLSASFMPSLFLLRVAADGTPDATLGPNGVRAVAVPPSRTFNLLGAALQPDGRLLGVGLLQRDVPGNSPARGVALRLLADGTPDPAWGTSGFQILDDAAVLTNALYAVALAPDGAVWASGTETDSNGSNYALLARFLPDGTPDPALGGDGSVRALATPTAGARSLALDAQGGVVVGVLDGALTAARLTGAPAPTWTRTVRGTPGAAPEGAYGPDAGWRMLGVPGAATLGDLADDLRLDLPVPTVYGYDGGYTPLTEASPLTPGRGLVAYLYDNAYDPLDPDRTLDVTAHTPASAVRVSGLPAAEPFHLLANPFAADYDPTWLGLAAAGFQETVQVWDPLAGSYTPVLADAAGTTDALAAWQGFFAERSTPGAGADALAFLPTGQTTGAPFVGGLPPDAARPSAGTAPALALTLTSLGADGAVAVQDAALVAVRPGAEAGWDRTDATKLAPLGTAGVSVALVAPRGDAPWPHAVLALPDALGAALAVGLDVAAWGVPGTLALSWTDAGLAAVPPGWSLVLTDRETGARADLRTAREVRFAVAPGAPRAPSVPGARAHTGTPRFTLAVVPDGVVADAPAPPAAALALAVAPNPTRGAATATLDLPAAGPVQVDLYDALGRHVARLADGERAAGRVALALPDGLAPGVYAVRAQAGERVVTQRLTVVR